ncbi:cell envelope integrity TolA C-terminal domain-containing protein [Cronobacter condimenti]|nr:cell envelope integrity TolA C-terminal domain-containing protein [Cronobacter condimenti]
MKLFMLAFVASLVTGCTPLKPSVCHKTTATASCGSGKWGDHDEWGAQARAIRAAINAKIAEPQIWEGKKCRLHIEFAQNGMALKISTSDGDKAYCEAVKSAAQKATFPAFTNQEVYRDFEKSRFDLRG